MCHKSELAQIFLRSTIYSHINAPKIRGIFINFQHSQSQINIKQKSETEEPLKRHKIAIMHIQHRHMNIRASFFFYFSRIFEFSSHVLK
jgi:hypothetical protein